MDNNEIRLLIAKHFDYVRPNTGQVFGSDWFLPKHEGSLKDLIEELTCVYDSEVLEVEKKLDIAQDKLESQRENFEALIEELEEEIRQLNEKEDEE